MIIICVGHVCCRLEHLQWVPVDVDELGAGKELEPGAHASGVDGALDEQGLGAGEWDATAAALLLLLLLCLLRRPISQACPEAHLQAEVRR